IEARVMKEKRLSSLVRGMLEQHGAHVSMVESHAVSIGIPDLNYCINGREGWIELKTIHGDEMPKIRTAQRRWARVRVAAGGRIWFLCHQESTGLILLVPRPFFPGLSTFESWRKLCVATTTIEGLGSLLPLLTGLMPESQ